MLNRCHWFVVIFLTACISCAAREAADTNGLPYPFPVKTFAFTNQKQNLEMTYMDVQSGSNAAKVVVLLHGKNFSGAYWERTATELRTAGYRVIIPDQIGFGRSSKPAQYQYSFQQLAANTHDLLASLQIKQAVILGHSMGGMLAIRYALMYPQATHALILIDPIGLEDWKAKGVPYASIDQQFQHELHQTPVTLRAYEQENYYHGQWKPEYNRWLEMPVQFTSRPDYPIIAWNQALLSDMIFTQPVCYEFSGLKMPVLLMVGDLDRTAMGKDLVSEATRKELGNYPELARKAAAQMSDVKLVIIPGVGHLPQVEAFPEFIAPVRDFLSSHPAH